MNFLIGFFLFIFALNLNASATIKYERLFENFEACFILYDVYNQHIVSEYNPNNRCYERISPNSIFKIPLSLMAFNENIIRQNTIFKWDGSLYPIPAWNEDQTPNTWLKYSVVWVSQILTQQLGLDTVKKYLKDFNYGNKDFSGNKGKNDGLTQAWLSSSLKISAVEQLNFLKQMLTYKLPVSQNVVGITKYNLYQGQLRNGSIYYGKTGAGTNTDNPEKNRLRDGWYTGFIENNYGLFIFVSNMTDINPPNVNDKAFASELLKPKVINILENSF